jgi:hypothetical protein
LLSTASAEAEDSEEPPNSLEKPRSASASDWRSNGSRNSSASARLTAPAVCSPSRPLMPRKLDVVASLTSVTVFRPGVSTTARWASNAFDRYTITDEISSIGRPRCSGMRPRVSGSTSTRPSEPTTSARS